jgi:uncharacterized membrane protein
MSDTRQSTGLTIEHDFEAAGRVVDVGRSLQWLASGWDLFVQAPGVWVAISAILLVIVVSLNLVPLVGGVALAFLFPVLFGGLLAGCRELAQGRALRVDHLFLGFRGDATGKLVAVGLFSLAAVAIVLVVMALVGGGAFVSGEMIGRGIAGASLVMGGILLAALIGLALLVPLSMALWFAPPLILFGGMTPGLALKASFMGCLKNVLPFSVYGVVLFVMMVLAALPFLLGYLVLIPVIAGSIYASYADIYE